MNDTEIRDVTRFTDFRDWESFKAGEFAVCLDCDASAPVAATICPQCETGVVSYDGLLGEVAE